MRKRPDFSKFFKPKQRPSVSLHNRESWKVMQAWARAYTTIPLKSLVAGEFEAPQDCPILRDYEDAMNRVRTALKQIRQGGLTDEQAREQADVLEDAMSLAVQAMRDITFIAGLSVGHKRTIITQNMAKEEAAHSDQRPRG